ncbi:type IV pilin protein [Rhodoferax sp.]|uniref:type IV pilin protein n=1 Tax=Rhodoferax sp. TaxID=50421 RepID=UPI00274F0AAE|nr:type IV pilin protein [Rhodoferax sp.]
MKSLTTPHALRLAPRPNGFTLIELLVVVAIVGILAAVAYPSYMSEVRKSRRSDAVAALVGVQQAQERWRANNTTYASNTQLTALTTATPPGLGLSAVTSGGYYDWAVSSNTGSGYTLTATAVSTKSQNGDTGCTALVMTVTNGNATRTPHACWSK